MALPILGQRKMVGTMSTEELEIEALKLTPQERARLAEKLLESLENLSEDENAKLWAEEAERRNQAWDANPSIGRPADDVFRDASVRLK
jgi:putative addiction module component (TIGR02574 family)